MHYHAQWTLCHKKSLDKSKALAALITYIEQRESKIEGYTIAQKNIVVPAPISSDGDQYPPAQCTEITISWDTGTISVIAGGFDAS